MYIEELIEKSPIRSLEKSVHKKMSPGDIGVISGKKGIGKTACLVHITMDSLFQDKNIVHVSFSESPEHILAWYEDIFTEITRNNKIESLDEIKNLIAKNRVIKNFNNEAIDINKIEKSLLNFINSSNFKVDLLAIDGYTLNSNSTSELKELKKLGSEHGFKIWLNTDVKNDFSINMKNSIPETLMNLIEDIDILLHLEPENDYINLFLLKEYDKCLDINSQIQPHLKLDTNTLLIADE